MAYPYCNASTASGIIYLPKVGSKVIFYQVVEDAKPYAWILSFNPGDIVGRDFLSENLETSQNPAFEAYNKPKDSELKNWTVEDQGLEPGDMIMKGSKGNKIKIFEDGSAILKSTPINFMHMSPRNNRFYQWSENSLIRTPGSFNGNFNIVTLPAESDSSYHYSINRHFVNPIEQELTIQEEWGFVDKVNKATAGNYDDVPNKLAAKSSAVLARSTESAKKSTMSGYNVYKRKVFDFGGIGITKTPESANNEYFTEEIKSDGGYRVRIGNKLGASPKDIIGCEIYYKPDGTWSVGSAFGKIKVTETDMIFSTAAFEISLSDIAIFNMQHTHLATAPGSPTAPPIATPTPPGMFTAYAAIASKRPDENLFWTT